jgi:DNA-binding NarL/FixJ family response regulator
VTRNIDAHGSRERKQLPEEDRGGSQGSSESVFLRGTTHLPPSGSSPNRNALGKRECEVVRLLAEGKSNKEMASLMNISVKTVETYRSRIMWKLDIHSVAHLIRYAVQNKLVNF